MMNLIEQLNKTLAFQLKTLSSSDLQGDELDSELKRNKGIVEVAKQINDSHRFMYDVVKLDLEHGNNKASEKLIGIKNEQSN